MHNLPKINLQAKTHPLSAEIGYRWFENPHIELKPTRFHTIEIKLAAFDTGLAYTENPLSTSLVIDWVKLAVLDPSDLDGVMIGQEVYPTMEASIYLGGAHNWVDITQLQFEQVGENLFRIRASTYLDLALEGVGQNETFDFEVDAKYIGEIQTF